MWNTELMSKLIKSRVLYFDSVDVPGTVRKHRSIKLVCGNKYGNNG
jgi:hypothetical protein